MAPLSALKSITNYVLFINDKPILDHPTSGAGTGVEARVEHPGSPAPRRYGTASYVAARAAQWGADQELEACLCCMNEWGDIHNSFGYELADDLRAARRLKPQTLNSIALQMLGTIERDAHYLPEITDTIRRALEALPDA